MDPGLLPGSLAHRGLGPVGELWPREQGQGCAQLPEPRQVHLGWLGLGLEATANFSPIPACNLMAAACLGRVWAGSAAPAVWAA